MVIYLAGVAGMCWSLSLLSSRSRECEAVGWRLRVANKVVVVRIEVPRDRSEPGVCTYRLHTKASEPMVRAAPDVTATRSMLKRHILVTSDHRRFCASAFTSRSAPFWSLLRLEVRWHEVCGMASAGEIRRKDIKSSASIKRRPDATLRRFGVLPVAIGIRMPASTMISEGPNMD